MDSVERKRTTRFRENVNGLEVEMATNNLWSKDERLILRKSRDKIESLQTQNRRHRRQYLDNEVIIGLMKFEMDKLRLKWLENKNSVFRSKKTFRKLKKQNE